MNPNENTPATRREFLKATGGVVAASALAGVAIPVAHAGGTELIQVAIVGCGGRGTDAVRNALRTPGGPTKLVAMADAYADRLNGSLNALTGSDVAKQVDVTADRRFVGFDAYRKAMDCLKPGDVVILTTPCAFRWVHFTYAIEKKLNVFMEKPVTADGPTSRRMLALAADSEAKGLKVGVGLMSRHARGLQQLYERVRNGEIGDIVLMRGYRLQGPIGHFQSTPKPAGISELDYQVKRFHSFLWSGGGAYSDYNIHIIDHLCWMKDAWPVTAQGIGGRHYKVDQNGTPYVDQNFDSYAVEYTFPDGSKFFMEGRCMGGAQQIYSSALHGSKGMAIASRAGDCGGPSATYKSGQNPDPANQIWRSEERSSPYQNEWDALLDAIRNNKPHNEAKRGVEASLVTSLGRMAAHTGRQMSYDEMLNCEHEMAPGLDKLTSESPAPVPADANGRYPIPEPGIKTNREY